MDIDILRTHLELGLGLGLGLRLGLKWDRSGIVVGLGVRLEVNQDRDTEMLRKVLLRIIMSLSECIFSFIGLQVLPVPFSCG